MIFNCILYLYRYFTRLKRTIVFVSSSDVFNHSATSLKPEKNSKTQKVHTSSLEAHFITEIVMKIIRMCDQNKLAVGTNKNVGPFSLEALVITEFLMKIRGICDQNKLATTESSRQNFCSFSLEALEIALCVIAIILWAIWIRNW